MRTALIALRSLAYVIQVYGMMAIMGVIFAPFAIFSSRVAHFACHTWCAWALWSLRWMTGLQTTVRGEIPQDEVLVAAKHQSFLDIILIYHALPRAKFIMKRELMYAPVIGQFALKIGCVPVERGKRGAAIAKMLADVEAGRSLPGQLIIYPQGTRVAPGVQMPYKPGTAALYGQLCQPCVPVATNAGLFWARRGLLKKPGLAVVEFLPRIVPGLGQEAFLARLELQVEAASDRLLLAAGWEPKTP